MTQKQTYKEIRMRAAKRDAALRRPKLAVVPHLFIFHVRSLRPNDQLTARRGFGSRTTVHSHEGSSGVRETLTPSNYSPSVISVTLERHVSRRCRMTWAQATVLYGMA